MHRGQRGHSGQSGRRDSCRDSPERHHLRFTRRGADLHGEFPVDVSTIADQLEKKVVDEILEMLRLWAFARLLSLPHSPFPVFPNVLVRPE